MTEALEAKGIEVNKDSLALRVKNPRRIADLEAAQDKKFNAELGISEGSDEDSDVENDKNMKNSEGDKRGRRDRR